MMWHRLKNFWFSLRTYPALSPDWRIRQRVSQALHQRRTLNLEEWFERFCRPQGIPYPIAQFAYLRLGQYSGLEFGRLLPSDRLDEDLCWSSLCWFDWELRLCDDFWQQFGVDLSDRLDDLLQPMTIGELVWLLYGHWRQPRAMQSIGRSSNQMG